MSVQTKCIDIIDTTIRCLVYNVIFPEGCLWFPNWNIEAIIQLYRFRINCCYIVSPLPITAVTIDFPSEDQTGWINNILSGVLICLTNYHSLNPEYQENIYCRVYFNSCNKFSVFSYWRDIISGAMGQLFQFSRVIIERFNYTIISEWPPWIIYHFRPVNDTVAGWQWFKRVI